MPSWISSVAAVAAAVFSLVAVVLTARLTRTSQVQQWRRDSAMRTMSRVLEATTACSLAYFEQARSLDATDNERDVHGIAESFVNARERRREVLHALADLELVASRRCIDAAYQIWYWLDQPMAISLRAGGGEGKVQTFWALAENVVEARESFVATCRVDLGIDRRLKVLNNSRRDVTTLISEPPPAPNELS
ncbi:hypothetical protein Q5425_03105 [Amycolatopsis sp. A133]|uniref:hypothetical protein n=1 Tax=Amycolatopsis sp. A133 TaxID=3064472 RepID=UPI0027FF0C83|nr:hypothetical protein [Amycolatopsis sp. A133]MDQ7802702.1 hypothetical protein [Amycolatopsis sp. A133]